MYVNTSSPESGVIFWVLNDYGVTGYYLVINACIVILAGFIIGLNCLVLHTLMKLSTKEPTDIYLCGLAASDALAGVFLLYNTCYNMINFQIFLECAFRMGLIQLLFICSMFYMSALTVDRYIKIVHPFNYTTACSGVSVKVISFSIWAVALVIGLLPVLGWNKRSSSEDVSQDPPCGFFAIFDKAYLVFVVVLFAIPVILMAALYLHIFKIASRHARAIESQGKLVKEVPFRDRHAWKYTKTVFMIVGVYLLCWLPSGIVLVLHVDENLGQRTTEERGSIILYASAIAYFNSLANPIIYAFKIPSVRKRFIQVFCRKWRKSTVKHSGTYFRDDTRSGMSEVTQTTVVITSRVVEEIQGIEIIEIND